MTVKSTPGETATVSGRNTPDFIGPLFMKIDEQNLSHARLSLLATNHLKNNRNDAAGPDIPLNCFRLVVRDEAGIMETRTMTSASMTVDAIIAKADFVFEIDQGFSICPRALYKIEFTDNEGQVWGINDMQPYPLISFWKHGTPEFTITIYGDSRVAASSNNMNPPCPSERLSQELTDALSG